MSLGTNNYNEFRMLQPKFEWFSIDTQTLETSNEAVLAMKAYKQCELAQTMVIYLLRPTEVSLIDSQ